MKATARAGTPHHMETKDCKTPSEVKNFLKDRVKRRAKWAAKFALDVDRQLQSLKEEIDTLDVNKVKTGDTRRWSAKDDYSGVEFVFEFTKEAP